MPSRNSYLVRECLSLFDLVLSHLFFYVDFLPHIVGAEDYDKAVMHCLDCLRNPRLTR